MSISAFIIALQLAGAQADPGSTPAVAPDPPAIEHQNLPAITAPAAEMADRPEAEIQAANPANPVLVVEPPTPVDTIVVTARPSPPAGDPLQALNAQSFSVVQSVDAAVTGPIARTYKNQYLLPCAVACGISSAISKSRSSS